MGASENMAFDSLMLRAWPLDDEPRLRFYGWERPCATCGVSQRAEDFPGVDPRFLVRRPGGGGLVRHSNAEMTYAFAVSRRHLLFSMRPADSYVEIHGALARAARLAGAEVSLLERDAPPDGLPAECFRRPSAGDVMLASGRKLAGAAQKRTRDGLLVQGYVALSGLPGRVRGEFAALAGAALAGLLGGGVSACGLPQFDESLWRSEVCRFAPFAAGGA